MKTLSLLLLPSVLAVGCVGSISVDGGGGNFGPATSSAMVELDFQGDTAYWAIVSSRAGLCSDLQDAWPASVDRVLELDLLDLFDDGACNTLWEDLAEIWDPVLGGGANLTLVNQRDGSEGLGNPREGSFDVEENDAGFGMAYMEESPHQELADARAGCDVDGRSLVQAFTADDGAITWEGNHSDGWRIDFEVELEDEGGADSGAADGGFGANVCTVSFNNASAAEYLIAASLGTPWLID